MFWFTYVSGLFQLLGELLLDRHNFAVMTKYIGNPDNLKLMMNLLKDKSRNIQFEAFHVVKVRVQIEIRVKNSLISRWTLKAIVVTSNYAQLK